jgi:hypothetical protein
VLSLSCRNQHGVKMTNEAPKGMKQCLRNYYHSSTDDTLSATGKPVVFRKLLYGECVLCCM